MSETKPPATAGRKSRRTVTVDYLTAASHPDAVVTGVLLVVIVLLALVGTIGLIEPVISFDLFNPDLGSALLLLTLGKVVLSVLALTAAGLGLAKHPRFPAFYLIVTFGLTLLIAAEAGHMLAGIGLAGPGLAGFEQIVRGASAPGSCLVRGFLVVLGMPYVVLSRRCRLIFYRRIDVNDLKSLVGDKSWSATSAAALAPALPSFGPGRLAPLPPKRAKGRRAAGVAPATGASLSVPATPPQNAQAAALWAALYGTSRPGPGEKPSDEAETTQGSGAGKRVGLEALINLRPPGS